MSIKENSQMILREIETALANVDEAQADRFVEMLLASEKVFVVGVGRVMLSMQAFAKRLNHIGIKTWYVGEINEPAITDRDVLVVASGSGESVVPVAVAQVARKYNAKIVHIGSNAKSALAPITDLMVRIPVKTKLNLSDEIPSQQAMSSLFEQSLYVFCDAVASEVIDRKKIDVKALWHCHANLE